jgi:ataxin-10
LVADVPHNQECAFVNEPTIRALLHFASSFFQLQQEKYHAHTRMLIQALSNILTSNNELQTQAWTIYMAALEEDNILSRLLASPDTGATISVMVLILNCINDDRDRSQQFCREKGGTRTCTSLLDRISLSFDSSEGPEEKKVFEIGYQIFKNIFTLGLAEDAWRALSSSSTEPITPSQTILFKLLDSYLHTETPSWNSFLFLVPIHLSFCSWAADAIRPLVKTPAESEDQSPDIHLPRVCEALVLTSQCLLSACLSEKDGETTFTTIRSSTSADRGHIEIIVGLLNLLELFLPRLFFGQVQPSPMGGLSTNTDPAGFAYLKRDLVRILGTVSHRDRHTQDRLRDCGGIPAVMNLCVVDERNPYLREHALFALRNILEGNEENQALVRRIEPLGRWDENGQLQDIPGGIRK